MYRCTRSKCTYKGNTEEELNEHLKTTHDSDVIDDTDTLAHVSNDNDDKTEVVVVNTNDNEDINEDDKTGKKTDEKVDIKENDIKEEGKEEILIAWGRDIALEKDINVIDDKPRCAEPGCNYEPSGLINLEKHLEIAHDIGNLMCDKCSNKCAVLFHIYTPLKINICRDCLEIETEFRSRLAASIYDAVRKTNKDELKSHLSVVKKRSNMKHHADVTLEFRSHDTIIYIFLDIEEGKYVNNNYRDAETTMKDMQYDNPDKLTCFIRCGIDKITNLNNKYIEYTTEKLICETVKNILKNRTRLKLQGSLHAYYINYSSDNKLLCKTYPSYLINSSDDLPYCRNSNKIWDTLIPTIFIVGVIILMANVKGDTSFGLFNSELIPHVNVLVLALMVCIYMYQHESPYLIMIRALSLWLPSLFIEYPSERNNPRNAYPYICSIYVNTAITNNYDTIIRYFPFLENTR
jgi:hypothetical protein